MRQRCAISIIPSKEVSTAQVKAEYKFRQHIEREIIEGENVVNPTNTEKVDSWGYTYAGWLVRLSDKQGKTVGATASQPVLVKYLNTIPISQPKK